MISEPYYHEGNRYTKYEGRVYNTLTTTSLDNEFPPEAEFRLTVDVREDISLDRFLETVTNLAIYVPKNAKVCVYDNRIELCWGSDPTSGGENRDAKLE